MASQIWRSAIALDGSTTHVATGQFEYLLAVAVLELLGGVEVLDPALTPQVLGGDATAISHESSKGCGAYSSVVKAVS
jgi:hypothetical protein